MVATALRTSIRITNRFQGRTASLPAHLRVAQAIEAGDGRAAADAARAIIDDVIRLIPDIGDGHG